MPPTKKQIEKHLKHGAIIKTMLKQSGRRMLKFLLKILGPTTKKRVCNSISCDLMPRESEDEGL